MKQFLILLMILSGTSNIARADVFDEVASALRSGNAKEVSKFFNSNVELTMVQEEGVYSKHQAEVVLKNFLSQNPPKSVTLQHKGSSAQGARYAIYVYECSQTKYRAYVFMKDSGNGLLIHELRIEKD